MNRRNFAFDRTNFILLAVSFAIVVIGFILMSGGGTDDNGFNASIFNARRIKLAPAVCFIGFVSMIYAVVRRPKRQPSDDAVSVSDQPDVAEEAPKKAPRTNFKRA